MWATSKMDENREEVGCLSTQERVAYWPGKVGLNLLECRTGVSDSCQSCGVLAWTADFHHFTWVLKLCFGTDTLTILIKPGVKLWSQRGTKHSQVIMDSYDRLQMHFLYIFLPVYWQNSNSCSIPSHPKRIVTVYITYFQEFNPETMTHLTSDL